MASAQHEVAEAPHAVGRTVTAVGCATAGAAALVWRLSLLRSPLVHPVHEVGTITLLVLFACCQASLLNVQVRAHARAISLAELPIVLGLLTVSPGLLILCRVAGALTLEIAVHRRYRAPMKLAFNTLLFTSDIVVAVAVMRLLDGGGSRVGVWAWAAALTAGCVSNLFSALAVAGLIRLLEGTGSLRETAGIVAGSIAQALAVGNLGIVAALALARESGALPLAGIVVMLGLGYRAYAALAERHASLENLYSFSNELAQATSAEPVLTALLVHACALTLASQGRYLAADGRDSELADDRLVAAEDSWAPGPGSWIAQRCRKGTPFVVSRRQGPAAALAWLDACGLDEAMVAPLVLSPDNESLVVLGNRLGDIRGFDEGDLNVLTTLTNQAAVSLRNTHLVEQLLHDSLHDPVTGLGNRIRIQQEIERHLTAGRPVVLAMLDLDSFKDINDSFGHERGDEVLVHVAERLTSTIGDAGLVCRFGGDEFAVALHDEPTREQALELIAGVLDALRAPLTIDGTLVDIGASVGLASGPSPARSWAELARQADLAMYAAKTAGRSAVFYDESLTAPSRSRLAMVAALHRAIDDGDLDIAVQPKADTVTGTIVSVEALARWQAPGIGFVSPAEFIEVAEHSGLIRSLTDDIVQRALRACAGWQPQAPGVGVAVNISVRCLQDDHLRDLLCRLLGELQLSPSLITLEITESSIMIDSGGVAARLTELRDIGLTISIDDFGTGHSSLSYLRQLPVAEVKIDRSFILGMAASPDDAAIVRAVVQLGHVLGMRVVAEGVETARDWAQLQDMGCDVIQGYHLARPMPVAAFGSWFAQRLAYGIDRDTVTVHTTI